MRNALVGLSTVTLDMTDAIELSEVLAYLAQWLELADDYVNPASAVDGHVIMPNRAVDLQERVIAT